MRSRRWFSIATAIGLVLPASATSAPVPAGSTVLVSLPALGTMPSGAVNFSTVDERGASTDGRYVVFSSHSDGLLAAGTTSDASQVFWLDRLTGTMRLVSAAADGTPGNGNSFGASISGNGDRVVFSSEATNLTVAQHGGQFGVFERTVDPSLGAMQLMSRAADVNGDAPANNTSGTGVISDDGTQVAFISEGTNMIPGLDTRLQRVYRRNVSGAQSTVLISQSTAEVAATLDSYSPLSISATGNLVAFATATDNLSVITDTNAKADVYRRDVSAGTTLLVSRRDSDVATATGDSSSPAMTADGQLVAFSSSATDLTATADTNNANDIYLRDLNTGTTSLISRTPGGQPGNGESVRPSYGGTRIGFSTLASDLVAGVTDTNATYDLVVHDLGTNSTRLLSRRPDGNASAAGTVDFPGISLSTDGTAAVFSYGGPELSDVDDDEFTSIYGVPTGGTGAVQHLSRPPGLAGPFVGGLNIANPQRGSVSTDGRYVLFASHSDGLVSGVADRVQHLFVRDLFEGTTTLVDRADGSGPVANALSSGTLSADGRHVAFATTATNLAAEDTDALTDVYVRDLDTEKTTLVARADGPSGAKPNATVSLGTIDDDGSRVAFSTAATNLGAGEDADRDVFVRDRTTGATLLVSRADGSGGASANLDAFTGFLDGDGDRVLFQTGATNLGDGDSDATVDIHLRDLSAGTTTLVSRADGAAGSKTDVDAAAEDLNADGTVALVSTVLNGTLGAKGMHVRNIAAGTTTLASRADGAAGAAATHAFSGSISADGRRVIFVSFDATLMGGAGSNPQYYVRDLATSTTFHVSRGDGPAGAPIAASNTVTSSAISGDGHCAVFSAPDRLGATTYATTDFRQVYLRSIDGTCAPAPAVVPVPTPTPTPTATPDATKPVLDRFSFSNRRFAVSSRATALSAAARRKAAPKGTRMRLRLSEKATVRVTISRELTGRRRGKRCVKPTAKLRKAKRCVRLAKRGTIKRANLAAGTRSIAFSGRLGRKALAPGAYRAVAVATDPAGNVGTARTARFTIVRR